MQIQKKVRTFAPALCANSIYNINIKFKMKKGIHPENYRPVVFKDMSNGDMFLTITRSTLVRASSLTPQVVSISS